MGNKKKESKPRIVKGDFCYDGFDLCIAVSDRLSTNANGPYDVVMLTGPDRGKVVPSGDCLLCVSMEEAVKILQEHYRKPIIKAGDFAIKLDNPENLYKIIDVFVASNTVSCTRITGPNAPVYANILLSNVKVLTPEAAASLIIRYYGK